MAQAIKVLAAVNDQIEIDVPTDQTMMPLIQVGAWGGGTLVFEGMVLGASDYVILPITNIAVTPNTSALNTVVAGIFTGPIAPYDKARVRVSVGGAGGKVGLSMGVY
jgi:hypothetical protein